MVKPAPRLFAIAAAAAATLGIAPGAGAMPLAGLLPQSAALISMPAAAPCREGFSPAIGAMAGAAPAVSKASAILGGHSSRLEMLRLQQTGAGEPAPAPLAAPPSDVTSVPGRDCRAGGAVNAPLAGALAAARAPLLTGRLDPGDFLASKRLRIGHTAFDAQWRRVSRMGLSSALSRSIGGGAEGHGVNFAVLSAVNAWTNAKIRYAEDSALYGTADYWADAASTLRRRAGDCEDIAIVKMQLLAAMGLPKSRMYLTLARDLARNADHAVLIVELDGKYWMLDNATSAVLDAREAHDYRPIMSFSGSRAWLHGYAQAPRIAALSAR